MDLAAVIKCQALEQRPLRRYSTALAIPRWRQPALKFRAILRLYDQIAILVPFRIYHLIIGNFEYGEIDAGTPRGQDRLMTQRGA
jgi:hypothetical protein